MGQGGNRSTDKGNLLSTQEGENGGGRDEKVKDINTEHRDREY